MRSKLGRAYAQGKAQWARAQRGSGGGYGGYRSPLTDGLERSIESELGVLLRDFFPSPATASDRGDKGKKWPVERIRIRFTDDASPAR